MEQLNNTNSLNALQDSSSNTQPSLTLKRNGNNKSRKNRSSVHSRPNMDEMWNSFDESNNELHSLTNERITSSTVHAINTSGRTRTKNKKQCKGEQESKGGQANDCDINPSLECLYNNEVSERTTCDVCGAQTEMTDDGYVACINSACGIIYKDVLDQSPEWRFYGSEGGQTSDPSRCGIPINPYLIESSYGCKIVPSGGKSSYEMRRIRQYTEWQAMPYSEKSRYEEFQYISMMANHSGFTKHIVDDAIKYYKKLTEYDKTFRGDNKDGLTAAAFYLACRANNYPLTAKELAAIFHMDVSSATQGCKNAQNILNYLEKDLDASERTAFQQTKPEAFVERYCTKLYLNAELTRLCHFIAIKVEKENLMSENTPHAIAAGIVYFVTQLCKMNVTKRDIHEISEISEVTINKCYKKVVSMTAQLVPSAVIRKYGYEPAVVGGTGVNNEISNTTSTSASTPAAQI